MECNYERFRGEEIRIYANGAVVHIFKKDHVAMRLYWKSDVFSEYRETYEYYLLRRYERLY